MLDVGLTTFMILATSLVMLMTPGLAFFYGGLGCMGEDGRKELELLRRQTSLEDLQIVVYWPCRSLKDLQEVKKVFPFDFIFVSDFKLDDSPMKIKYGAQATPTCFLTDEHHVVKVKCGGLRMDLFDKYVKRNE